MKLLTSIGSRASNVVQVALDDAQDQNRAKSIEIAGKEQEEQDEKVVQRDAYSERSQSYSKRKRLVEEEERIDERKREIADEKREEDSRIDTASNKRRTSLGRSRVNKQDLTRLKADSRRINQIQFILDQGNETIKEVRGTQDTKLFQVIVRCLANCEEATLEELLGVDTRGKEMVLPKARPIVAVALHKLAIDGLEDMGNRTVSRAEFIDNMKDANGQAAEGERLNDKEWTMARRFLVKYLRASRLVTVGMLYIMSTTEFDQVITDTTTFVAR